MAEKPEEEGSEEIQARDRFQDGAICENCVSEEYAIAFCEDCKRLLCEECLGYHKRQRDTKDHNVVESPQAEQLRKVFYCEKHSDKTLDFFCSTCNTPICQHCSMTNCVNKEHKVLVSTDVRAEMTVLLDGVKEKKALFKSHLEYIKSVVDKNTNAMTQCEGEIKQLFKDLVEHVEERRDQILQQLRLEADKNFARIAQQREFVECISQEMDKVIESTENLLKTKKDAKLMVNRNKTNAALDGRMQHEWNTQNAKVRSWKVEHKDLVDYTNKFGLLIPKPKREDIVVEAPEKIHVGITNKFTVTVDMLDQLELNDSATIDNFLSVKIVFKPAKGGNLTTLIKPKTEREGNVWTVSYLVRQQGRVEISVSVCGVEPEEQSFILSSDPSQKEIKVDDRVERGPDWKWDNQDGGEGSRGTVKEVKSTGWVNVKWDNSKKSKDYRWGAQDCYDLKIVQE